MSLINNPEYSKQITGAFTANGEVLDITSANKGTTTIQVTGTWVGTIILEISNDNSNWLSTDLIKLDLKTEIPDIKSNGIYTVNTNSFANIRLRTTSWTSGTANISTYGSDSVSSINIDQSKHVPVYYGDSGQLDAFSRLRASFPTTLFDSQFHFDKRPEIWSESITGTATSAFDSNSHTVAINLGTASGNSVIRQTIKRFKYDLGKSSLFVGTSMLGAPKANTRKRYGLFDADNGLFFEVDSTAFKVVVRSSTSGSVVDTAVPQSDWNIDKFDGTGPSRFNINLDLVQIFVIDFQWLGSGRVRFGFYFGGRIFYCHEISFGNTLSVPYMQSGNLPVRIEATNTGTTTSNTLVNQNCTGLIRESLNEIEGVLRAVNTGISSRAVNSNTERPILSIRVKSTRYKAIINILSSAIYVTGNSDVLYNLRVGTQLTGASWVSNSPYVEYDISATSISSGGILVDTNYIRSNTSTQLLNNDSLVAFVNSLIGHNLSNETTIITIGAQALGGNASVYGSISYREIT